MRKVEKKLELKKDNNNQKDRMSINKNSNFILFYLFFLYNSDKRESKFCFFLFKLEKKI